MTTLDNIELSKEKLKYISTIINYIKWKWQVFISS
jgi:hypothetical protein